MPTFRPLIPARLIAQAQPRFPLYLTHEGKLEDVFVEGEQMPSVRFVRDVEKEVPISEALRALGGRV